MNQLQRQEAQARDARDIFDLNKLVKVRLAPSKIAGVGVFAMRDLKKGEKLYSDIAPLMFTLRYSSFNKLRPEVREIILEQFPNVVNGSAFAWPTTRLQAYMNHGGDESNYSPMTDTLTRDVKINEEITEDYRNILNYQKVFPWIK